jgi:hypothetical protein
LQRDPERLQGVLALNQPALNQSDLNPVSYVIDVPLHTSAPSHSAPSKESKP